MSEKIQPSRRVDDTRIVIMMRQTVENATFLRYTQEEIEQNAQTIQRSIQSILIENGAVRDAAIIQDVTLVCPECGHEWEIDPDSGLPCCCAAAESSWKDQ